MAWLAIRLHAQADTADAVADALLEAGALSVSCDDADAGTIAEASQFAEPGLDTPRPWRHNILTALVAGDSSPAIIVAAAALSCGIQTPRFSVS
jgi:ribosomal protein L11 methyltransferase